MGPTDLEPRVGVVVPTLGERDGYLQECLLSIRRQGPCFIIVVAPSSFDSQKLLALKLVDQVVEDPKIGLAGAINEGIRRLPNSCEFVTWLGDDDLFTDNSLKTTSNLLASQPKVVGVYGACDYIDSSGKVFWTNKSGSWALKILNFGPNRIPQPGSLIRRTAFNRIGGLDETLGWAFDQDMFAKLNKIGCIRFIPQILGSFRWHGLSLSAGQSSNSIAEASRIRLRHVNPYFLPVAKVLEKFHVSLASSHGGKLNRLSGVNE